ncbi:MAG: recombination protein NinG [Plesiomonas shigelloides]
MANSKRRCKQCGEYGEASSGVKVPLGWFCSHAHVVDFAIERAQKARDRQQAKAARENDAKAKEDRKVWRQRKMDVKPLSYWAKRAQAAFNAYIRERDAGLPCVSCDHPDDGSRQRHASHFRSVGACSSMRFHPDNVWAACSICNNHLSGNVANFKTKLIAMLGAEKVEWIESQPRVRRWTREELEEIEVESKAKLKALRVEKVDANQA